MGRDEIAAVDDRPQCFDGETVVVAAVYLSQVGHRRHQGPRYRPVSAARLAVATGAETLVELRAAEVLESERARLSLGKPGGRIQRKDDRGDRTLDPANCVVF